MRINNLLIVLLVTIQYFFGGGPILNEVIFLSFAILFVVATVLVTDLFTPLKHLATFTWVATGALILIMGIVPTIGLMQLRYTAGNPLGGTVHDDPLQQEAAANFLLHGKNPYVENYFGTELESWSKGFPFGIANPALYHVISLPGHLLLSTGFYGIVHGLTGYFDERILYLVAYLVALGVAAGIGKTATQKIRGLILVGLNPFVLPFFVEGRNDILVFAFLIGAFALLARGRRTLAFALFGAACTIKLFAVVFLPFVLIAALGQAPGKILRGKIQALVRPLAAMVAVIVIVIGPFIIWNAPALYDDVIRYSNGTSPTSYPINGVGLSTMLLNAGVIANRTDYYPFWIFQVATVLPMLIIFLPRLYRRPRWSLMIYAGTLTLFAAAFFGRFMNDNYYGLFLLLVSAGYLIQMGESTPPNEPQTAH